jgi:hypothetical protein
MTGRASVSVVVPARDEGPHVRAHLGRITAEMERLGRTFEVLLVDDGSRDATRAEAEALAREDARVRVLAHERNLGKGAALATGCAAASGEVLVFLDADLEISPDQVGPILALVDPGGADVAVGSKYHPLSTRRRPLARVLLSRLYQAATAVLFRLPIRDTQTGLKVVRRRVARAVVPAIRAKRYAWDIELLLLAHRIGARIASGPVSVDFLERGARIPWRGFLASGIDTLRAFVRDRWFAGYARDLAGHSPRAPRRRTRVLLSADDLGLGASVDRRCLSALRGGQVRSVSLLVEGPTAASAAASLASVGRPHDAGVHLDLARGSLSRFLLRSATGRVRAEAVRAAVRAQVARARALGVAPTHVDAHRHAFFLPWTYRAVLREGRAQGIASARLPLPLGTLRVGDGVAGIAKGLALTLVAPWLRPLPRRSGVATPDGVVDAALAERWVAGGRLPAALRGRTVEVIAHPGEANGADLPPGERGLDRDADARRLATLRAGLEALGAETIAFSDLRRTVPGTAVRERASGSR